MNNKYIVVIVGIILILSIFSTLLLINYPTFDREEDRFPVYYQKLNQTKVENKYILNFRAVVPITIDLKGFEWRIMNQSETILFRNKFPHISGEEGSTFADNISITWFDNDNNKKLSVNDTIIIESPSEDLSGYIFGIAHTYDERYYCRLTTIVLK